MALVMKRTPIFSYDSHSNHNDNCGSGIKHYIGSYFTEIDQKRGGKEGGKLEF